MLEFRLGENIVNAYTGHWSGQDSGTSALIDFTIFRLSFLLDDGRLSPDLVHERLVYRPLKIALLAAYRHIAHFLLNYKTVKNILQIVGLGMKILPTSPTMKV